MTKHHHMYGYLLFLMILLVALIGIIVAVEPSITGRMNWQVSTVKYISCRYFDEDPYGVCLRVERQEGTKCNPPMDEELTIGGGESKLMDLYKIYEDFPDNPNTVRKRLPHLRPCADRVGFYK